MTNWRVVPVRTGIGPQCKFMIPLSVLRGFEGKQGWQTGFLMPGSNPRPGPLFAGPASGSGGCGRGIRPGLSIQARMPFEEEELDT